MKKIVIVTSGSPGCNPRVVKEADALSGAGYQVKVIYCYYVKWADDVEKDIIQEAAWDAVMVGGHPMHDRYTYLISRLKFKLYRKLYSIFGIKGQYAERSMARGYDQLLTEAINTKADLYIGHNLATLPVVVQAAQVNRGKAVFDFEDYHRGEVGDASTEHTSKVTYLENKYLPSLDYLSFASPLIMEAVRKDHLGLSVPMITILNCFPKPVHPVELSLHLTPSLRLFWFSQTIGLNRGLETVLQAMVKLNDPGIELWLAGRLDDAFADYISTHTPSIAKQVHFAGIIAPGQLTEYASQFDIGLAIELYDPVNRDICLTNKVFTYLLAGNAIIFSDTRMQRQFCQESGVGYTYPQNDVEVLVELIRTYQNPNVLSEQRAKSLRLGIEIYNWQIESGKLLQYITEII